MSGNVSLLLSSPNAHWVWNAFLPWTNLWFKCQVFLAVVKMFWCPFENKFSQQWFIMTDKNRNRKCFPYSITTLVAAVHTRDPRHVFAFNLPKLISLFKEPPEVNVQKLKLSFKSTHYILDVFLFFLNAVLLKTGHTSLNHCISSVSCSTPFNPLVNETFWTLQLPHLCWDKSWNNALLCGNFLSQSSTDFQRCVSLTGDKERKGVASLSLAQGCKTTECPLIQIVLTLCKHVALEVILL